MSEENKIWECPHCCSHHLEEVTESEQFGKYSNGRRTISVDGEERYCPACDYYFMICNSCSDHNPCFRKFLGTEGVFIRAKDEPEYDKEGCVDSELYVYSPNIRVENPEFNAYLREYEYHIIQPWGDEELSLYPDEIAGDDLYDDDSDPMRMIPYYVGFKDLYHLPPYLLNRRVWPTGPDGNYEHFWKCTRCGEIEAYSEH